MAAERSVAGAARSRLRPFIMRLFGSAAEVGYRHHWLEPRVIERGFPGFSEMLHQLRSVELSRMPRSDGPLLSAGAAGTWYFEWIAEWYGPVSRHIGIELYSPQPDDLPDYVEWIKNSVADMKGVADQSIGLVFSGQNFEHLFHDDATDFLLECHRVLTVGGSLVIDSPNRDVTGPIGWSHPEHTIEFTPDEAAELVTLAGFDVTSVRGLWLCREPGSGESLGLWDSPDAPELTRRTLLATDHPEDSFVWWLEATNTAREPDIEGLRRRHAEIFALAWPERQQRLRHAVGDQHRIGSDLVVSVPAGAAGAAMLGPDMPFAPGHYTATLTVRRRGTSEVGGDLLTADVYTADGTVRVSRTLTDADLQPDVWTAIPLDFDIAEVAWGGQFRVFSTGLAAIDVQLHVELSEVGTRVAPSLLAGN